MATVWTTTATFRTTPADSYQLQGFDPALPLPVAFLNWKLYDLDLLGPSAWRGYVTAASGGSSTALVLRGGSGSGGASELYLDSTQIVFNSYTGGTLEAPTGGTSKLSWTAAGQKWFFSGSVGSDVFVASTTNGAFSARGGNSTGSGLITRLDLDTTSIKFSTYGTGTPDAPTGAQTLQLYWNGTGWYFNDTILAEEGASIGLHPTTKQRLAYRTGSHPTLVYHLADSLSGWAVSGFTSSTDHKIAYDHDATNGEKNHLQITATSNNPFVCYRSIDHLVGGYNADAKTGIATGTAKIVGFTAKVSTKPISSTQTISVVFTLWKKPRDGSTGVALGTLTVPANTTVASYTASPNEILDTNLNSYYVRAVFSNTANNERVDIEDMTISLTKFAVE